MIVLSFIFWMCYCDQMKNKKHGVSPHFSVEVLKQRYLECECPIERTHWHIIWLLADTTHPRTPCEVAEIVGCTPDWVRKLLKRYNANIRYGIQIFHSPLFCHARQSKHKHINRIAKRGEVPTFNVLECGSR